MVMRADDIIALHEAINTAGRSNVGRSDLGRSTPAGSREAWLRRVGG